MKKSILLAFMGTFALASCQKDYKSNPTANDDKNITRGTFKCKINGNLFEGELKTVVRNDTSAIRTYTVTGKSYDYTKNLNTYNQVSFTIKNIEGTKEYKMVENVDASYKIAINGEPTKNFNTAAELENSNVTVSSIDGTASGTFKFELMTSTSIADTMRITDGEYSIPLN